MWLVATIAYAADVPFSFAQQKGNSMAVYRPKYRDAKTCKLVESEVWWWYKFTFAGKRVREFTKTSRKTIAVEAEKNKRLELERALAGMPTQKPRDRIRTVSKVLQAYHRAYPINHRAKSAMIVKER